MARTDAIVLGTGIVGVSVALYLAKRGLAVALVDRGEPGQGTSYGNAGIIEGNTLFPARSSLSALIRVALKRAPEADYHIGFLGRSLPGCSRSAAIPRRSTSSRPCGRCGRCSPARWASTRR